MAVRCGQSLVATLLLLIGCADNPPAVIENKSVAAVDVPPEVRQADSNFPDYGRNLAAGRTTWWSREIRSTLWPFVWVWTTARWRV